MSEPDVVASDAADSDFFGLQLSLHGNTLAVGAPTNLFYPTDHASAWVFVRENGAWDKGTRLSIAGPPDVAFGNGVSVHGDTLIVGAPPGPDKKNNGQAVVYVRSGMAWAVQQTLAMPNEDIFGIPVRVQGDMAWVGASTGDARSLYVFSRAGTTWTQVQKLPIAYSYTIAVNGGTLALGEARNHGVGAVHVFRNATQDPYGDPDVTGTGGTDAGAGGSATGGASATSGGTTSANGGAASAGNGGGMQVSGGAAATGGGGSSGGNASGGASAGGNAGASGSSAGPPEVGNANDSSGCGCQIPSRAKDARGLALVLMGLAFVTARWRGSRASG